MSKKKPTKKDIEIVISNLINHLKAIEARVTALDNVLGLYMKYKKEETGFQEWMNKQLEEKKGKERSS